MILDCELKLLEGLGRDVEPVLEDVVDHGLQPGSKTPVVLGELVEVFAVLGAEPSDRRIDDLLLE